MYKVIGADGREYGPVSAEQLRGWIAEGRANAQTMVQPEGGTDWKPLSTFPEFAEATVTSTLAGTPPPTLRPPVAQASAPVSNYLAPAILCTIFCCLPFGIPAIVYAAQVNSKVAAGDIAGAMDSSKKAKMWCWASLAGWFVAFLLYVLVILTFGMRHMHRRF